MRSSVIFSVIALLGYGLDGSLAQEVVRSLGNKRTIFWRTLLLSLTLGLLALFGHHAVPARSLLIALLIAVMGYLPILAFYQALKVGKLGIVFPVANSSAFVSVLLAAVILGERLNLISYVAILLVVLGNIGLVLDFKALRQQRRLILNTGTLYAVLACVGWGTVFFLYKYPTDSLGPSMSAFIIELGVFIASAVHLLVSRKPSRKSVTPQLPRLALMVVFASIGVSFFTLALQKGPVGVVNSLVLASGSVGVLYGRLVKKEVLRFSQYLAAFMVIAGIVLLGANP